MANLSEKLSDDDASVLLSEAANPDVERDDYSSGQRVVVDLGFIFNRTQLIGRCLSTFLNLGALIFIAYLYDHWRPKPAIKVDVLIPSFFPVCLPTDLDLIHGFKNSDGHAACSWWPHS